MSKENHGQRLSIDQPLVSICIPTYNAERTVEGTLESILKQAYRNIEVLVADNASTDKTVCIVQEIDDPRIQVVCNDTNIGAEKNFSRCVHLAKGEYAAVFHADDLYMPDMVLKQMQTFQNNPTIGAVFTMAKCINNKGDVIGETNLPNELRGKGIYFFPEVFLSLLRNGNFFVCPSAIVSSKLYRQLMPFAAERFGTSADLDMWLRILERQPVAILEDKLMHYRVGGTQGSYKYNYLRTEQADFFKVMNYYLSAKSGRMDIPKRVLNGYEILRCKDNLRCAINHLAKSQSQDAKNLLRRSLTAGVLWRAMSSVRRPTLLAYWIVGTVLLGSVYLGVGQYVRRWLRWFLYERKR